MTKSMRTAAGPNREEARADGAADRNHLLWRQGGNTRLSAFNTISMAPPLGDQRRLSPFYGVSRSH